jgi:hypothetical protein
MARNHVFRLELDRRRWLKLGVASAVAASLPGTLVDAQSAPLACAPPIPQNHEPSNGGSCPYPIPWLDKNGNHNQIPMPNVELSNIFHFKGKLARCNGFRGMGTDNKGNRLAWGTPTTDYSYMAGEYWAARQAHQAVFAHTWLTVFKGPAVPANQIHDFHSPISPEGLYWVMPVPSSGITFSSDDKTATVQVSNAPIIDQPRWPAMDAESTPAFLDFKLVFKANDEPVKYENAMQQHRFEGFKASAQLYRRA